MTNGIEHSLEEIDQRLAELAPQYSRNMFRETIRDEVNELLDQRNFITQIIMEATTE